MSYWTCKGCSKKEYIFGEGAVLKAAEQYDVPFLGEIPIHKEIAKYSDEGILFHLNSSPLNFTKKTKRMPNCNFCSRFCRSFRVPKRC